MEDMKLDGMRISQDYSRAIVPNVINPGRTRCFTVDEVRWDGVKAVLALTCHGWTNHDEAADEWLEGEIVELMDW